MPLSQILVESEIDNILVGNPQITYFKSVYRRHTQFYKGVHTYEKIKYDLNSISVIGSYTETFSYGTYDLISNIFLENKITGLEADDIIWANLGNNFVEKIGFEVGSTELCKVEAPYMEARSELDNPYVASINESTTVPPILTNVGNILKCNTGSQYNVQTMAGGVTGGTHSSSYTTDTFYTYPNFYFCREYGSAFPICALNNSEVNLVIHYRDVANFIKRDSVATIYELETSVNVEYINISDDERRRFINNTDIYIYYDIENINYNKIIDEQNGKNYPIRQMFFIGQNYINSVEKSLSTPISLSGSTTNLTGINIKVNSQKLYEEENNNLDIFTKQNLNRLYPGYGRELGYNRIKVTVGAISPGLTAGTKVVQAVSNATGILAETAAISETIIYIIVTSNTPFVTSQVINTLASVAIGTPGAGGIVYEPLGYNDSIGVHSFCLDTTNTPSGHLSANTRFSIDFKGAPGNILIYLEAIKFFRIQGGQLGLLYV